MKTIVITGWNRGFKKVSLTTLLQTELKYSLSEAKRVTDAVLNNQRIAIELPEELSTRLIETLNEIGVKFDDRR